MPWQPAHMAVLRCPAAASPVGAALSPHAVIDAVQATTATQSVLILIG
jgi:hypothetical protein